MRRAFFVMVLCLVAASAVAQEQRGSIEGVVKDSSGAVLPGVTIEARSPNMVGVQTATSDAQGGYRFPALPPGKYTVTAALSAPMDGWTRRRIWLEFFWCSSPMLLPSAARSWRWPPPPSPNSY